MSNMYEVVEYDESAPHLKKLVCVFDEYKAAKKYAKSLACQTYSRMYVENKKVIGYRCAYSDWAIGLDGVPDNLVYAVTKSNSYDLRQLQDNRTVVVYGEGNATRRLVLSIVNQKKHIVFASSASTESYENAMSLFVTFNEQILNDCIQEQQKLLKRGQKEDTIIVLDNILTQTTIDMVPIRVLFQNGRPLRLGCIITMDNVVKMNPVLNANTNYTLMYRLNGNTSICPIHSCSLPSVDVPSILIRIYQVSWSW